MVPSMRATIQPGVDAGSRRGVARRRGHDRRRLRRLQRAGRRGRQNRPPGRKIIQRPARRIRIGPGGGLIAIGDGPQPLHLQPVSLAGRGRTRRPCRPRRIGRTPGRGLGRRSNGGRTCTCHTHTGGDDPDRAADDRRFHDLKPRRRAASVQASPSTFRQPLCADCGGLCNVAETY